MTAAPLELAPGVVLGGKVLPFVAGPCVLESEALALEVARHLAGLAARHGFPIVFKASFDKANRSSRDSFRGPGLEAGLEILVRVKEDTGLPVLTDVHEASQCAPAGEVCDVLQIPAFLCRQTDLVEAAARTGRAVNLKKGQFVAPDDMPLAVEKAREAGDGRVCVTERGASFGYNNLVVDMRSFSILAEHGIRTIYDATHSLQLPGGGRETGGDRRFAAPLARAAVAAGADGVFFEVHPDPANARSDRTTQLPLAEAEGLMLRLSALKRWLSD